MVPKHFTWLKVKGLAPENMRAGNQSDKTTLYGSRKIKIFHITTLYGIWKINIRLLPYVYNPNFIVQVYIKRQRAPPSPFNVRENDSEGIHVWQYIFLL